MAEFYHSVTLNEEKCVGCTNCIKRCPTEAIRVRGGKAVIASERCIDCGECIRICPHHAKRARYDQLSRLSDFTYTIALPAPSLYGQFNNLDDIDYVLTGLKELGFDDVFEVSRAAELVSEATRKLMDAGVLNRPVISSACPAVVRLIRVRFPDLCEHVLPLKAPMEVAAMLAREAAVQETGYPPGEIGVFFLSPCAAKVTDVRVPIGVDRSNVDGVLAISDIYPRLLGRMNHLEHTEALSHSGIIGVSWSSIGGEAAGGHGRGVCSAQRSDGLRAGGGAGKSITTGGVNMELRPEIVSELWHSDLIESEDCGLEESQEFYRQVKEGRDLPPDVWQIGDTARFIRLKDGAPSPAELQQLLQFKQIELLKSIRRMVLFFVVLTVIGLALWFWQLLSSI